METWTLHMLTEAAMEGEGTTGSAPLIRTPLGGPAGTVQVYNKCCQRAYYTLPVPCG